MSVYAKAPDSRVDFSLDWTDWLGSGETISSASWRVDPDDADGLTLDGQIDADALRGIHVSGGVRGHMYRLLCRVTTSAGRVVERGISLKVMER